MGSDRGRLIIFAGAKGGVGVSSLVAGVSEHLSSRKNAWVLVGERGSRLGGGVSALFNYQDACDQGRPTVTIVDGGGVALDKCLGQYDFILIDAGTDEIPPSALCAASHVLLVGTPDVIAARGLQELARSLRDQGAPQEKLSLIVNQVAPHLEITPADIQAAVGIPVLATVPEDREAFVACANRGQPVTLGAPESAAARGIVRLATRLIGRNREVPFSVRRPECAEGPKETDHAKFRELLRDRILASLGPARDGQTVHLDRDTVKRIAGEVLHDIPEAAHLTRDDRQRLVGQMAREMVGLGALEPYLEDDTVSEIMVNGHRQLFVERAGRLERVSQGFASDDQVLRVIERIIGPLGRRIDESSPMVDARLPDGSRINAVIPPLAVDGPLLTVRKFAANPWSLSDLVRFGTLTEATASFLADCVKARRCIMVAGGAGSGKTTLLNALSGYIPGTERIITIEDAAELRLQQEHVARLEARPPNIEGKGAVHIRDLVRNALRMRPDRIIIGEVRGAEALDMLQAMNTGHAGSMSTIHANSPRDALARLETMVLMAGVDLPVRAIRDQIAAAVDLIVHQERLRDGSRKITSVAQILGVENGEIVLEHLFVMERQPREADTVGTSEEGAARLREGVA